MAAASKGTHEGETAMLQGVHLHQEWWFCEFDKDGKKVSERCPRVWESRVCNGGGVMEVATCMMMKARITSGEIFAWEEG